MSRKIDGKNTKNQTIKSYKGIIFGFIAIAIIALISTYSYNKSRKYLYGDFNSDKKVEAEKYYKDIMALQTEEDYPKTPEEVIQLYNYGYKLIYGNMINNEELINNVVHQQRKLFTEELLQSAGSLEEQLERLKGFLDSLDEKGFYIIAIEQKPAIYDRSGGNTCYIRVSMTGNDFSEIYMNYYLLKDENGLWKIQAWKEADENFNE